MSPWEGRLDSRAAGHNSLRGSCTDHDNPDPQRVAVAALGREHLVLNGEVIAQRADDPADLGLVLVVVADDDVANRAVQQQLEAKRIVESRTTWPYALPSRRADRDMLVSLLLVGQTLLRTGRTICGRER
jgi:hypothetical protein